MAKVKPLKSRCIADALRGAKSRVRRAVTLPTITEGGTAIEPPKVSLAETDGRMKSDRGRSRYSERGGKYK